MSKIPVICEQCGKGYELTPSLFKRSKHHFCSKACAAKWHTQPRIQIECTLCGKALELRQSAYKRSDNHFCSLECYRAWLRQEQSVKGVCDHCGKRYIVSRPSQYSKFQNHFCSKQCHWDWMKSKKSKARCVCDYCGAKFELFPCQVSRVEHNFCSRPCSERWRSENEGGETHPLWNRIKVKCAWCERTLQIPPNRLRRSDNFFCSRECKSKWWTKNFSGENSFNWQGGKSFEPYPLEFNRQFKKMIRLRDDHSCAICRMFGKDVHHVNYTKEDLALSNCITLCHKCHLITNHNREYWQGALSKLMIARGLDSHRLGLT